MARKQLERVDVQMQVNLGAALASLGIMLEMICEDLMFSDRYAEETSRAELAIVLQRYNMVVHEGYGLYRDALDIMEYDLPDGVGAIVVPNPLLKRSMEKPEQDRSGDPHREGDEFPF